jgi:hypothetical protein
MDPNLNSADSLTKLKIEPVNVLKEEPSLGFSHLSTEICYMIIGQITERSKTAALELQARQKKVRDINAAMRAVNAIDQGELDLTNRPELIEHLQKAKDLGADIRTDKLKYTREERDRLLENMRTTNEEYTMQNEMQSQEISRMTSQYYEALSWARSVKKAENDMNMSCIKKWRG